MKTVEKYSLEHYFLDYPEMRSQPADVIDDGHQAWLQDLYMETFEHNKDQE
jgi:hypothetical protein